MYTDVSEAFAEKIISHSRTFRAKLVFDDMTVTDGIYSIKTKGGSCADTELKIGCTVAATAEIVINETNYAFKNKEFSLYIGLLLDDDSIEYVPCGVYTVRSVSTKDKKTTLSAADRMYIADKTYKTQLRFPTTADKVVEEICSDLGVPYNIDVEVIGNIVIPYAPSARATMREILGKTAMLAGCNAMFDRTGTLVFKWYEESGYVTDLDFIDDPEIDEEDYTIRYLVCDITDTISETYGDEKAVQGMTVSNEFAMTQTLGPVWDKIGGTSYRPCQVRIMLGDIRLDPWDKFSIDMGDASVSTISMNMDFEYDGGLLCTVSATAPDTDSGYVSPAQVKEQKQAEITRNNSLVLVSENDQTYSVDTSERKLLSLQFTTQQESLPFINVTVQLEIIKSGIITALVKINDSVHSSYSISGTEGYDIMSFSAAFTDLAGGANQLDIFIVGTDDGIADIQAKQASVILTGYGLVARTMWDGNIILTELIGDISTVIHGMSVDKLICSTDISVCTPMPILPKEQLPATACPMLAADVRKINEAFPIGLTGVRNIDGNTVEISFSNMVMVSADDINIGAFSLTGLIGQERTELEIHAAALESLATAYTCSNRLLLQTDLTEYSGQITYTIAGDTGLTDPFTGAAIVLAQSGTFNITENNEEEDINAT